jgi:hypothetical protein
LDARLLGERSKWAGQGKENGKKRKEMKRAQGMHGRK